MRRTLDYINAGHNNPILRRSNGTIERLDIGGLPLGILLEAKYEWSTVTLAPGDWLVIFTDGLVEAVNRNDEEYGEARLLGAIDGAVSTTPPEMLKRLMAQLDLFVGSTLISQLYERTFDVLRRKDTAGKKKYRTEPPLANLCQYSSSLRVTCHRLLGLPIAVDVCDYDVETSVGYSLKRLLETFA